MCSFPPVRTPKLQLTAEQPLTGECWIPPKKDTPHARAKEKPQQDDMKDKITFRIKPHTHQSWLESSNKTYLHQETPHRLSQTCLWVFECLQLKYRSAVAWRRSRGFGYSKLGYGISPLGRGHHYPHHRATRTDSWRAQTKPVFTRIQEKGTP